MNQIKIMNLSEKYHIQNIHKENVIAQNLFESILKHYWKEPEYSDENYFGFFSFIENKSKPNNFLSYWETFQQFKNELDVSTTELMGEIQSLKHKMLKFKAEWDGKDIKKNHIKFEVAFNKSFSKSRKKIVTPMSHLLKSFNAEVDLINNKFDLHPSLKYRLNINPIYRCSEQGLEKMNKKFVSFHKNSPTIVNLNTLNNHRYLLVPNEISSNCENVLIYYGKLNKLNTQCGIDSWKKSNEKWILNENIGSRNTFR